MKLTISPFLIMLCLSMSCQTKEVKQDKKIRVIFDTDTNNELDDQHALAYYSINPLLKLTVLPSIQHPVVATLTNNMRKPNGFFNYVRLIHLQS